MKLQLVRPNDPILREVMPVYTGDPGELRALALGMWELMRKPNEFDQYGAGLAAPQVGQRVRMFVLHVQCLKQRFNMADVCINPSYVALPEGEVKLVREGCLSWPGRTVDKERITGIKATWTTLQGKQVSRDLYGIVAQAYQHECDHMDGRTIL